MKTKKYDFFLSVNYLPQITKLYQNKTCVNKSKHENKTFMCAVRNNANNRQ